MTKEDKTATAVHYVGSLRLAPALLREIANGLERIAQIPDLSVEGSNITVSPKIVNDKVEGYNVHFFRDHKVVDYHYIRRVDSDKS